MNVFVIVTPFQLYVVRRIISQYHHRGEDNLIVSTIKGERDFGILNVASISRGIKGFYDTWKLKRFIIIQIIIKITISIIQAIIIIIIPTIII